MLPLFLCLILLLLFPFASVWESTLAWVSHFLLPLVELVEWRTVRGLGFKSPGSILTSRTETSSLSRVVRDGWDPCSLYREVGEKKVSRGGVIDLAVEQPQLFRKLHKNKTNSWWSLRLGCWTAATAQKTTQKQNKFTVESSTWLLNSRNCSENYTKTKQIHGGVFDLAVEQPQLFRKLHKNKTNSRWSLWLGCWTAATLQKTTQKQNKFTVESLTWLLNSRNCSENYTKTKQIHCGVFDLAVEQPQLFRKQY